MIDDNLLDHRFVEPECIVEEAEEVTLAHVLTYPVSIPGLSMISIYAGVPFVLLLMLYLIPHPAFRIGFFILAFVINCFFLSTPFLRKHRIQTFTSLQEQTLNEGQFEGNGEIENGRESETD